VQLIFAGISRHVGIPHSSSDKRRPRQGSGRECPSSCACETWRRLWLWLAEEERRLGLPISEEALAVAQANAEALGVAGRARLISGDWRQPDWQQRLGGPFDLLVSNPPYIEAGAIERLMPEVARFEPKLALDGGPDGLDAYRTIATAAPVLVAPGGRILVEAGEGQATEISKIFASAGLAIKVLWKDLAGIDRVVSAMHSKH